MLIEIWICAARLADVEEMIRLRLEESRLLEGMDECA
jgi:hypothetical protein